LIAGGEEVLDRGDHALGLREGAIGLLLGRGIAFRVIGVGLVLVAACQQAREVAGQVAPLADQA
jgi:hypothetical protein